MEQKVVQMLTSHVFFHFKTEKKYITSVLQVLQIVNHGALRRLTRMDIILMENGDIVTAIVKQVMDFFSHLACVFVSLFNPKESGLFGLLNTRGGIYPFWET